MELEGLLRQPQRWASVLMWATVAGLEMGIIGPFGSYKANIFNRIVYWMVLCWGGSVVLWPSIVTALSLGPRRGLPPLFSGTAAVFVVGIPLAGLAAAGCYLFWPVHASGIRMVEWYALTIVVLLPSAAGLFWLELARLPGRREHQALATGFQPATVTPPGAGLSQPAAPPLPEHLIADALCLQMEDHYIRIHTSTRSYLHAAVMRDVVDRIGKDRGLQVHRSWWVARQAVQGWFREDRSVVLVLVNDLRVPVARNRLALVRERGWLVHEEERSSVVGIDQDRLAPEQGIRRRRGRPS